MDLFQWLTAAAFVVPILPYVASAYGKVFRRITMRSFWDGKSNNYTVVYPVQKDEGSPSKEWRLVKHETVSAVRRLDSFLSSHGCKVTLKSAINELSDEEKQANVVFVGSSRTNPMLCKLEIVPSLVESSGSRRTARYATWTC